MQKQFWTMVPPGEHEAEIEQDGDDFYYVQPHLRLEGRRCMSPCLELSRYREYFVRVELHRRRTICSMRSL